MTTIILAAAVSATFAEPRLMTCGLKQYPDYMNSILYRVMEADKAVDRRWTSCKDTAELKALQREVREAAVKTMGGFPEKCPLNPEITGTLSFPGCRVEKVMFESRPNFHVTAYLYLPDDPKFTAPYPAILSCCGHSDRGKEFPCYSNAGLVGARHGFATLVYDPCEQGERHQLRDGTNAATSVLGHNRIGQRAILLGTSMMQVRIYDGIRAIDYLETRGDVIDRNRIAVWGMSGGGTLSAYMNAFDDRLKAAAPAGYLCTMRDLYDQWGPQDSEQQIFGQLKFGLNHLGFVCLRAPSPIQITASYDDAFPYCGTATLKDAADEVFRIAGAPEKVSLYACPGVHHWYPSQKEASCRWFDKWLNGNEKAYDGNLAMLRRMDIGYAYTNGNEGVASLPDADRWVTKTGCVLGLSGEKTMYDIYRERLAAFDTERPRLSPELVRRVTGIAPVDAISCTELPAEGGAVISRDDDLVNLPVVIERPERKGDLPPVMIVSDTLKRGELADEVGKLLEAGREVAVVDIRGFGENSKPRHSFYTQFEKNRWPDEQMALELMALGDNLVARRAEDVAVAARYVAKALGRKPVLRAEGRACVSAAHAAYLEPRLFAGFEMVKPPVSWRRVVEDDTVFYSVALLVPGGLCHYDWADLAAVAR